MPQTLCPRHAAPAAPASQRALTAVVADSLGPFAAVDDMMTGDFSENGEIEAANHFGVSQMAMRSQSISFGRLDRDNPPVLACGEERDVDLSARP